MMRIRPPFRRAGLTLVVVAAAAVVGISTPASAAEFTNGGFESPTTASPYCADGTQGGSTIGSGWTVTASCLQVHAAGTLTSWEGGQHVDLSYLPGDNASMSQTFDTVAGTHYIVTFAYGNNYACATDNAEQFTVSVDGQETAHTDTIDVAATTTDVGWTTDGYFFEATGTSATVTFAQTTPGDGCGVLLDDIRVVLDPDLPLIDPRVAAGVGAAALGGFAAYRLRRRSAAGNAV